MSAPAIVQVTAWNSRYLGNFMSSQLRLAEVVGDQLGLATHLVLADGAQGQPWLDELPAGGITWSIQPRGLRGARALRSAVRRHHGALVHTHFTSGDVSGALVAAEAGVPCVWHMHTGFEGYSLGQRLKDLAKIRGVGRGVDRFITVAPWLTALAQRRGVPPDRVVTVPNAIVTERFRDLPDRAEARDRLQLPLDAEVVLGFAWWPQIKGADVMIDALRELVVKRPNMVGVLVGSDALRTFAEAHAADAPWLRIVQVVEDPAWLYAAADVFVSASRQEGQPYAVGEALACGLPVVLSDIDGTSVYKSAPMVPTFPSGRPEALARRVEELLALSVAARREAAAHNREWAFATMSIDEWCDRLCALYRDVLCTRRVRDARRQSREAPDNVPPRQSSARPSQASGH